MPSLEFNRGLIYVGSILQALGGLAIMSFASAAINQDPPIDKVWWMIEGGPTFLIIMVIVAVLLMFLSVLGLYGAKSREHSLLFCFYFSAFVFILVRLIYAAVIFEANQPEQLQAFIPLFKQKWLEAVETTEVNVDSVVSQRAAAFLTYVNEKGACCGFDAVTAEQNPPGLECTSETTCQETFLVELQAAVEKQCIVIFVFASIEAVALLLMCGMTCRYKSAPAFVKIKNGVGSNRKV